MSWISDVSKHMKRIVLMDDKVARLADNIDDMRAILTDHEKRLIRIETMIEMSGRQSGRDNLDSQ
jgi:hypothetical protein